MDSPLPVSGVDDADLLDAYSQAVSSAAATAAPAVVHLDVVQRNAPVSYTHLTLPTIYSV